MSTKNIAALALPACGCSAAWGALYSVRHDTPPGAHVCLRQCLPLRHRVCLPLPLLLLLPARAWLQFMVFVPASIVVDIIRLAGVPHTVHGRGWLVFLQLLEMAAKVSRARREALPCRNVYTYSLMRRDKCVCMGSATACR